MAFAISPRPPIMEWLSDLDATLAQSKGFFASYPVALDLSAVQLSPNAITQLIGNLAERNIRVLGIEGADFSGEPGLPPTLRNGRGVQMPEPSAATPAAETAAAAIPPATAAAPATAAIPGTAPAPAAAAIVATAAAKPPQGASLLIEDTVRSGQSVVFFDGDVTVLGSVGSGAEIVAGGSIHIYGTLRGRALAGAAGNARARIFCRRVEAELLAINSYYKTAEDIEDIQCRGPVQAWLEGSTLKISALN